MLNAKFHEKEAEIIAQAGRPGALTIATNMAGRGTDIVLGGNWEVEVASLENATAEQIAQIKADWQKRHQQVIESGGLHVIAPSATNRAVSTTSCVAVPAVRVTRVPAASTCRWKTA